MLKQQQSLNALAELHHEHQDAALSQEPEPELSQLNEIECELVGDILTLFDDNGLTRGRPSLC
jgi:hypothetical protein